MAGSARVPPTALPPARLILRTALAKRALSGPGRVPHRLLAAAALLVAARSADPLTPATAVAAAAGTTVACLVSAHHHLVTDLALSHREGGGGDVGGRPSEADRLSRALGGAGPLEPSASPASPASPAAAVALRASAVTQALALLAWAEGPAGPRPAQRVGCAALAAGTLALAAAGAGLAFSVDTAAAAFHVPPGAVGRAVGVLRRGLLAASPAAPWLGRVKAGEVHFHLATLVRAAAAVGARAAAAAEAAPRLTAGAVASPPGPVTPGDGGKKRAGGAPAPRPRTRARTTTTARPPADPAGAADSESDDSLDEEGWAEYIRSPEEVAFVQAVMSGRERGGGGGEGVSGSG